MEQHWRNIQALCTQRQRESDNVLLPNDFLTCGLGSQCYYRDGHATAVDTASASVVETGLTGNWTVTPGSMLEFTLNTSGTAFVSYADMALHWGETCQNDVIEGVGTIITSGYAEVATVPEPPTLALLGLGLLGFGSLRRRKKQ